ncbi:MAG: hypothetical protein INH41_15815 [Myxococcaceae bacterium]|nr:hypothetical protein [Myxococcaceae bacterium]MCA3013847.1 hypothetical protein [Myxococcaceae bacterium]
MAVHEYRPASPRPSRRAPFPAPWGLLVVLGVYLALVAGYVWKTYFQAPEYQAARHYAEALALLGVDDGRSCSEPKLREAFRHVLEAARLMPQEKALAVHSERLRWRFDERGFRPDVEDVRKAELVSLAARQADEARQPWLVTGSRDRGWAPDQLLAGPERAAWWAAPGVVLIIAIWGYGQFNERRARARAHEREFQKDAADLDALAAHRRGLGEAPRRGWRAPEGGGDRADMTGESDAITDEDTPGPRGALREPTRPRPSAAQMSVDRSNESRGRRQGGGDPTRASQGARPMGSNRPPALRATSQRRDRGGPREGERDAPERRPPARPAAHDDETDE